MSNYDNSNQIDVGLWEKVSQAGNKYYFGKSETHKYILFRSGSDNPKAPSYKLLVAPLEDRPKEEAKKSEVPF